MYSFTISPLSSQASLVISHPTDHQRKLTFNISTSLTRNENLFDQLNEFLSYKPIAFHVSLYEKYEAVNTLLTEGLLSHNLNEDLAKLTTEIFDSFEIDEIFDFITFRCDSITIPSTFDEVFVVSADGEKSKDQTYLRSEYQRLICLSIKLRSVLMIFSIYISHIKGNAGTLFKEFHAVELIKKSKIFTKPDIVIEKLETYTLATANGLQHNNAFLILNGISTDFFLEWIISVLLIRRVAVNNITGDDPKLTLITGIYSYITQRLNPEATGEYRSKREVTSATGELDNKTSVLESYKVKSDISIGSLVELEVALMDFRNNAYRLSPNLNEEDLTDALKTSKLIKDSVIVDPVVTIARTLFSLFMPSRSIYYVNREILVNTLAVSQAVLYEKGHHFLANLVTSVPDTSGEIVITGVDSRSRLDPELAAKLDHYYPYQRKEASRNKNKIKNLAVLQIEKLVEQISSQPFTTTCSAKFRVNNNNSNRLIVPSDIKNLLAKFFIDIVELKALRHINK